MAESGVLDVRSGVLALLPTSKKWEAGAVYMAMSPYGYVAICTQYRDKIP